MTIRENEREQLKNVQRLGIMGGTFDPIHNAHLLLAKTALQRFSLDKIAFIPSGRPPHKISEAGRNTEQRACMTELAIAGEPRFFLSRIELDRAGYSYAYDTLRELGQLLPPDAELFFITGADSILDVCKWYRSAELPGLSRFIVAARPGYDLSAMEKLPPAWRQVIDLMEMPLSDISSSEIRRRVAAGESISGLLPAAVEGYIQQQGLYLPEHPLPDREEMRQRLQGWLSPKRYRHSLGVAELAEQWAIHWDLDAEAAYTAGLLHDMARGKSGEELAALAREFSLPLEQADLDAPVLLHAGVGAKLAQREFGLNRPDILEAITRHTLPAGDMGPLACLIYLADICEPNRPPWPEREKLLALCTEDLDQAMICGMEQGLRYLREKGETPHPRTMEVLQAFYRRAGKTPPAEE